MGDLIDRQDALDALGERPSVLCPISDYTLGTRNQYDMDRLAIETVPSAQPERKKGKWIEREVTHIDDLEAKDIITAWQSCKCSVCGRYDTRPYMYYFNAPKYCSWCGAEMEVSK